MEAEADASGGGHGHSHFGTLAQSTTEGVRALKVGVAGLAATTVLQAALLALSGSVALLGDTLHNGVDVLGTAVVWVAFRATMRARSERFSFGFHRIEDLAGLFVVALIAASAGLVFYESIRAFGNEIDANRPWLVLAAGVVGFAGNEAVAQYKMRAGRAIGSAALVADGRHSRADGLTSIGVVVAAIGLLTGQDWLDATIGLLIGVVIAWTAWESGRDVILRLVDASDPGMRAELEHVAEEIEGIEHINDLRFRSVGRTVHVVASVCMPADYRLAVAHETAERLRGAWLHALPPGSIVDIHVDPYTPGEGSPHPIDNG